MAEDMVVGVMVEEDPGDGMVAAVTVAEGAITPDTTVGIALTEAMPLTDGTAQDSLGGLYLDPWYYYGPPYYDPYALPPDSTYPEPAPEENYQQAFPETSGEWVEVPGQSVNGIWVPPHKVWVPDSSP